jgi:hypothetical protein
MAASELDSRYERAVNDFIKQVRQLAREELAAQLAGVVNGGASTRGSAGRAPAAAPAAPKGRAGRPKGAKRGADEIAATVAAVKKAIAEEPGLRSEQIVAKVGIRKQDVQDAIGRLLDDKEVRKRGVKRATKYFPS